MNLKGSKTENNLKEAFAGESQANRRYLYFAQKADVEGYNDVAAVFRSTAEGETGHAHGHLEYLEQVGDPATGLPIGATRAAAKRGEHLLLDINCDHAPLLPCQTRHRQREKPHPGTDIQRDHPLFDIRPENPGWILCELPDRTGEEIPQPPWADVMIGHGRNLLSRSSCLARNRILKYALSS